MGSLIDFQLLPSEDLSRHSLDGEWEAIGNDPHFILTPKDSETFTEGGWLAIECDFEIHEGFGITKLYWSDGTGYTEQNAQVLSGVGSGKCQRILLFPARVQALRFDPIDCPGRFRLRDLKVRRMTRHEVFVLLARRYVWRAVCNPRVYASILRELFVLWRMQGNSAVKSVFRKLVGSRDGLEARAHLQAQTRDVRRIAQGAAPVRRRALTRRDENRERIAVGLVEHIGDIIACEPVARYLRKTHPNAEIAWVVKDQYRDLIDSNPYVDFTITVDCLTDWIKMVGHNIFDHYVDLHINLMFCPCCRITLHKISGDTKISGENYFKYGSLLEAFTRGAGLHALTDAPVMYIPDAVRLIVDSLGLPERFVVVHAKSNDSAKDWASKKWAELLVWFGQCFGVSVVEIGSEPVVGHRVPGVINLCGATTLLETAEVIRRAILFIGIDSGPAHMANATGTPGVVLMGSFGPFQHYNPFTGGYGDGSNATLVRPASGRVERLDLASVQRAIEARMDSAISEPPAAAVRPAAFARSLSTSAHPP